MLMTMSDCFCHLSEERGRLGFGYALGLPYVVVHVAPVGLEEEVDILVPDDHLSHTGNTGVRGEGPIRGHHFGVTLGRVNLERTRLMSKNSLTQTNLVHKDRGTPNLCKALISINST